MSIAMLGARAPLTLAPLEVLMLASRHPMGQLIMRDTGDDPVLQLLAQHRWLIPSVHEHFVDSHSVLTQYTLGEQEIIGYLSEESGWVDRSEDALSVGLFVESCFRRQLAAVLEECTAATAQIGPPTNEVVLGRLRYGDTGFGVGFASSSTVGGMKPYIESLLTMLQRGDRGILLHDRTGESPRLVADDRVLLLPLVHVAWININGVLRIDDDALADALQPLEPVQVVKCSPNGSELQIGTSLYRFRGAAQRRVIRQLYEAYLRGDGMLNSSTVLAKAGSRCTSFAQLFKGRHEDMHAILEYGGGQCRLRGSK